MKYRLFDFYKGPRVLKSWASVFAGVALSLNPSQWHTAYTGHGDVRFSQSGLLLKPAPAISADKTHAALVLSQFSNVRFFDVTIEFQNIKPLRQGTPQPWEVFWLFFNYQITATAQKKTNYLILKPNGLEVGRATQETHQDILKTWPTPVSVFGQTHRLRLQRWSTKLIITVDQQPDVVYEFIKDETKPFDQKGSLGLYSEDAEVLVKSVVFKEL